MRTSLFFAGIEMISRPSYNKIFGEDRRPKVGVRVSMTFH